MSHSRHTDRIMKGSMRTRTGITFFLLLNCLFSFAFGQANPEKTVKVGLLHFSRSVWDEDKIGEELYNNLEGLLRTESRITIEHYFEDEEISYETIEGPKNMFENSAVSDISNYLETLCKDNKLDGIVFGHLQQDNEMIIVFRFYYSASFAGRRNISGANRIKSFSQRINPADLTPPEMQRITTQLIADLRAEIYEEVTTQPTVTQPEAQQTQTTQTIGTEQQTGEEQTETGTADSQGAQPSEELETELPKEDAIMVAAVYKMINNHGFYCDPNSDHQEVLLNLVTVENFTPKCIANQNNYCPFKYKRTISIPGISRGISNTISKLREGGTDKIPLYWAGGKIEKLTYKEAVEKIKELRQDKYGGYSDWRIPTVNELFSIVEPNPHHDLIKLDLKNDIKGNYLPAIMNLWTSTPIKDEGKEEYTDSCESNTAYFIIKKEIEDGKSRLKFHISCANDKYRYYVLPVSKGEKVGKKTSHRHQAIKPGKLNSTRPPVKKPQDVYIFDSIPPWSSSDRHTSEGKKMAEAVQDWLTSKVEDKIRDENKRPLRNVSGHTITIEINRLDYISSIIFGQSVGISDERRAKNIINRFMSPKDIDVLVGVKYNETYRDSLGRIFEIWPVVIFKKSQKLLNGKLELTLGDIAPGEGGFYQLDNGARLKLRQWFNAALGGKKIKVEETPHAPKEKKVTLEKVMKEGKKRRPPTTTPTPPVKLEPLYAAKLDFINAYPSPVKGDLNKKEVRIITKAVRDKIVEQLIEIQKKVKKKLKVNKQDHKISNTPDNIETLVEIINDEFKTPELKISHIVKEQMIPNKVDIIITGQYIFNEKNPNVTIRAIVLIKSSKKMLVKNLLFKREKLVNRNKQSLRKGAKKIIAEKVKEFLKGLYE